MVERKKDGKGGMMGEKKEKTDLDIRLDEIDTDVLKLGVRLDRVERILCSLDSVNHFLTYNERRKMKSGKRRE